MVYNIQILLIPKYDLDLDGTYISSEDDYFEKLHFLGTVNLYWSLSIWHEDVEMIAQLFFHIQVYLITHLSIEIRCKLHLLRANTIVNRFILISRMSSIVSNRPMKFGKFSNSSYGIISR